MTAHRGFNTPILITLPHFVGGEAAVICALQRAGAGIIHLRKPGADPARLTALLEELRQAGADFSRMTLHGEESLARQYGFGGIHLKGEALLERFAARQQTSEKTSDGQERPLRLSCSAHSWEEARRWAPAADYVWLSPVFDSISKVGYRSGIDIAEASRILLEARREPRHETSAAKHSVSNRTAPDPERIVALGGISPENIARVRMAGFGGAAVLGALWAEIPVHPSSPDTNPTAEATGSVSPHSDTNPATASTDNEGIPIETVLDPIETLSRFGRLDRRWKAAGGTLQLISDGDPTIAAAYLAGGGRWIQLRMKEASKAEIMARGRELAALCRPYGAILLLDDHPEWVAEAQAQGVHLGKNDMPPAEARRLLGEGAIIGSTANTLEDIEALQPAYTDYIGLGPFRYTTTKKNLAPLLGETGYRRILSALRERQLDWPVVAIGGIEPADLPAIMSTGVNGVAISGAIARSQDPASTTRLFVEGIARGRLSWEEAIGTPRTP